MKDGIHVSGMEASLRILRDLRIRAHDQRPGWRRVNRYLKNAVERQFDSQGVYLNGRRWQPLSPPYASRKRSAGFSGGILTRTGEMSRSFRILAMTKNRLVFGSRLDRAIWHQEGRGNNPRRPILNENNRRVSRDINGILNDYLTEGL